MDETILAVDFDSLSEDALCQAKPLVSPQGPALVEYFLDLHDTCSFPCKPLLTVEFCMMSHCGIDYVNVVNVPLSTKQTLVIMPESKLDHRADIFHANLELIQLASSERLFVAIKSTFSCLQARLSRNLKEYITVGRGICDITCLDLHKVVALLFGRITS